MKSSFTNQYNLSDAVPLDPTAKTVPAEAFAIALEEFMEDRFRGIMRIHIKSSISSEAILVSAEYAAYFFKTLLSYVYGRVFLNVEISCDKQNLVLSIKSESDIPLTESEMRFLIKTARNAGMEIYPGKNEIMLTLAFSKAAVCHVYAISVSDGKQVMLSKLHEMFFCGMLSGATTHKNS